MTDCSEIGFSVTNTPLPQFIFNLPGLKFKDEMNCGHDILDLAVNERGWGNRLAIISDAGERWSYRDLFEYSNRIANILVHDGAVPGTRVLLRGANHPMLAAIWFAVIKAGCIAVTTMPLLRASELTQIISQAEISYALCDASLAHELQEARVGAPSLKCINFYNTDDAHGLEKRLQKHSAIFEVVSAKADDICIIAFTSGTTGRLKGTLHFHRDIMAICQCFPKYILKPIADDVFCGSSSLGFTLGLGGLLLFPLSIGAATVLLGKATPNYLLAAIEKYRVTIIFTVPTAYRAMLDANSAHDLSSLRKCVSAGEALSIATRRAWREKTDIDIINGIGSTELLHIFASSDEFQVKEGAIGTAVPGYRLAILDAEGHPLPANQVGRLAVQGPTGCRYLNDVQQHHYVQKGWNLTGDTGYLDEDGYFFYQARIDDLIVSSGYNISPAEVEEVLSSHPAIAECGVVGQPNLHGGTLICAHVVLRTGFVTSAVLTAALQQYVKAAIAPYKYPRLIEYHDGPLPRSESGKLQRFKLRQISASMTI